MLKKFLVGTAIAAACIALSGTVLAASPYDSTLTGDWGGARQQMNDYGIDLSLTYVGEFATNTSGGTQTASTYVDQTALGAAFDFGKLVGWTGGSLHITLNNRNGDQLDAKANLGTLLQAQELYGGGKITRLVRFYLEQKLWNGAADIKLGRMDMAVDFYPFGCDFQRLDFCLSLPGWIARGVASYPISEFGAAISIHPSSAWYINLGAFKVNPNNTAESDALQIFADGPDIGTLTLAEVGWQTSLTSSNLAGHWAVGGWRNSANAPDLLLDVNGMPQVLTGAAPLIEYSSSGAYVTGSQQVTRNAAGGGLSFFANLVQADGDVDRIDQMESVGLSYKAPFASRPNDTIRFAVGRNHVSGRVAVAERLRNANGLGPTPVQGYEYVYELNYTVQLPRGIALMPNVQYTHDPGGTPANDDAVVLGLQVAIVF